MYIVQYVMIEPFQHSRKNRQKRRQRSSLTFGGRNWFNSIPHKRFETRMIRRKGWMEEHTRLGSIDASENGWSSGSHHIKAPTPKMDVQWFILAANWLLRHSSTSHRQQWRPLSSLLPVSSSMLFSNWKAPWWSCLQLTAINISIKVSATAKISVKLQSFFLQPCPQCSAVP